MKRLGLLTEGPSFLYIRAKLVMYQKTIISHLHFITYIYLYHIES